MIGFRYADIMAYLQGELSRGYRMTALGIAGVCSHADGQADLPGTEFYTVLGPLPVFDHASRQEFETWVLAEAFRDSLEALWQIVDIVWLLTEFSQRWAQGPIALPSSLTVPLANGRDFLAVLFKDEFDDYAAKGFRERLSKLASRFGINPDWQNEVRSINRVRGCLTHRRGIVGEDDIENAKDRRMHLRCFAMSMEVRPVGEKQDYRPYMKGDISDKEQQVRLDLERPIHKTFPLGTRISIAPHELAAVCYTIYRFTVFLLDGMKAQMQRTGLVAPDTAPAPPAGPPEPPTPTPPAVTPPAQPR
jgi:hypothetical protein